MIAGRITDSLTRRPVAGIDVSLSTFAGGMLRSSAVKTDAAGAYAFDSIAAGSYMLTAHSVDYQPACHPNTAVERCARIELLTDDKRDKLDLALTPNATARGRIVDENGTSIGEATVALTTTGPQSRGPNSIVVNTVAGRPVRTAANGTFEIRGVPAGTWYLEAWIPGVKESMGLPAVFYPGVFRRDEAARLEFSAGRVTENLNLVIPSISGNALTVHVTTGPVPIADVRAALIRSEPIMAKTIALNDEGAGTVTGLLPGRYFVAARGWIKDRAWAAFEIADFLPPSLDLSLLMKPAGSITGKIVAQNGGLPPLNGLVVAAGWTHDEVEINPMTPDQVPVEADGSFKIEGLFGKRAMRLIGLSPEWGVYAIRQGRSELRGAVEVPLDTTVDVTIVVARR